MCFCVRSLTCDPRFNSCVFAYGATGAGKTFTMLGNKENPGVIYKTVSTIYLHHAIYGFTLF